MHKAANPGLLFMQPWEKLQEDILDDLLLRKNNSNRKRSLDRFLGIDLPISEKTIPTAETQIG